MRAFVLFAVIVAWTRCCFAISFDELLASFDVLQTVAGTATITGGEVNGWLPQMEGGLAIAAELSRPHMTMMDLQGNLYIADKDAHAIRRVTLDGTIHTIAGTNDAGFNGDGPGTQTMLNQPNGLYTFPDGTTYILDLGNGMVRKLSPDGQLTTVVTDPQGILVGRGLWVSPDESTIYYSSGYEVRKWTPQTGAVTYASGFAALGNLAVDPFDRQLVVTDRSGNSVYKLYDDGTRERIAGNGTTSGGGSGQPANETGLDEVRGIWFHPEGGYFLATHNGGQIWFVDDNETIHLLIDGDNDRGTHAGDGLPLDSPGKKISEARAVTLSIAGDLIVTEHDGGFIRMARSMWPLGDFSRDGLLDVADIDLLSESARQQTNELRFDLNMDWIVDAVDRQIWVDQIERTYFGDANLDGEFNSDDFVSVFMVGQYEDAISGNSTWASGDWDGDADFTSDDFVAAFQAGGYERGPRNDVKAIPEPTGALLWTLGTLWLGRQRRRIDAGRKRENTLS